MIIEDSKAAREIAVIAEFESLVAADMENGVIDFGVIQERRYMKFWQHLSLTRNTDDGTGMEVVYWGTYLVDNFGEDYTGQTMEFENFGTAAEILIRNNRKVIEERSVVFLEGDISWEHKEYKTWYRISVPVLKSGERCCGSVIVCS